MSSLLKLHNTAIVYSAIPLLFSLICDDCFLLMKIYILKAREYTLANSFEGIIEEDASPTLKQTNREKMKKGLPAL